MLVTAYDNGLLSAKVKNVAANVAKSIAGVSPAREGSVRLRNRLEQGEGVRLWLEMYVVVSGNISNHKKHNSVYELKAIILWFY